MKNPSLEKPSDCALTPGCPPSLVRADYAMVAGILHDNFQQWSPGLKRGRYYHYQRWQYALPWARRHLSYWALAQDCEVLSSCKLYEMEFHSRSRNFAVAGLGAVFTAERNRGRGMALRLLEQMIELSRERSFDAVMLNSDIDPAYYQRVGFQLLSSNDFAIRPTEDYVKTSTKELERRFSSGRDELCIIRELGLDDIDTMVRHHARWLKQRPYGVIRSTQYWSFKLSRERYLHKHSALAWPKQEIITLNFGEPDGGYALFEQGTKSIRVLEVIGSEETCHSLWVQLLRLCLRRKITLLRGWEGCRPDDLKGLQISPRVWSRPMILPLNDALQEWVSIAPCPLLELDHY